MNIKKILSIAVLGFLVTVPFITKAQYATKSSNYILSTSVQGKGYLSCNDRDCSGTSAYYASGTVVNITAAAASGYTFSPKNWIGCDSISVSGTTCKVTMNYDRKVSATFSPASNTTQETPWVKVISPVQGKEWFLGSTYNIGIQSNLLKEPVTIQLYNNGNYVGIIGSTITSGDGSVRDYPWTVSPSLVAGNYYQIRAILSGGPYQVVGGVSAFSEPWFALVKPASTNCTPIFTSPVGGETWQVGNTYYISWKKECVPSDAAPLNLKLMTDKAGPTFVYSIAPSGSISTSQSIYTWTIPNNLDLTLGGGYGPGYYVEIDGKAFSFRSNNLTINSATVTPPTPVCTATSTPYIKILSPNGGESYNVGDFLTIKWQNCGFSSNETVNVYYYDTTTASTVVIGTGVPITSGTSGIASATIPSVYAGSTNLLGGSNYKAHVNVNNVAVGNLYNNVISDAPFTINSTTVTPTPTDDGCSPRFAYSSRTGQRCHESTTPLSPTSPALSVPAQTVATPALQAYTTSPVFNRPLTVGAKGDDVKTLQEFLIQQKLLAPGNAIGLFGKLTSEAVKRFQSQNNLEQVGEVGPKTRALLESKLK